MRITARVITLAFAASVMLSAVAPARAETDAEIEQIVRRQVQPMLIAAGGMAVALNIDGRTLLFNYGVADVARKTPITSDSLFNLASVGKALTATWLAQAVKRGEVALDDPVAKYVTELAQGGDIRSVTLGQLASHTSGLDRSPAIEPRHAALTSPTSSATSMPGRRKRTHPRQTGHLFQLRLRALALACSGTGALRAALADAALAPLGMTSTVLPLPRGRARPARESSRRARCRAYNADAKPVGEGGQRRGRVRWPGLGRSSRPWVARFLARLGAHAGAMARRGGVFRSIRVHRALAWRRVNDDLLIVDRTAASTTPRRISA
jgi:CubicO group peptidase (beta-lactamase class C family)